MQKIAKWFGLIMVPVYLGIGCAFVFTQALLELVPTNRTVIGIVFIVYGLFRLYMSVRLFKAKKVHHEK